MSEEMGDKFRDECGVFGIWGTEHAVAHTLAGLTALQHRGQDSAGIAVLDGAGITRLCRAGLVSNLRSDDRYGNLRGTSAIGHVRYSTVGGDALVNAQPLMLDCRRGPVALCHNGQIVNFNQLKLELTRAGAVWETTSDSELVLQLYKASGHANIVDAITEAVSCLKGAFSILVLTRHGLVAVRDMHGFRPLCVGLLGDAVIVCSETCALDAIGARYLREINPGEVTVIGLHGIRSSMPYQSAGLVQPAHCIFEHVYFARPDSNVFGQNVGAVRTRLGQALARQSRIEADVVVPVPDSGLWAAVGFHEESGIPMRFGLVRNNYVGRTFIQPSVSERADSARLKLNAVRSVLQDKRVILIDDSIVRGETMARIVHMVREAGAREVHVRISSPPTIAPCFYGINTPTKTELIAAGRSIEDVRLWLDADSLQYISLSALLGSVGTSYGDYCTACYTGEYRVQPHGPSLSDRDTELYQIAPDAVLQVAMPAQPIEPALERATTFQ
jgi:amidophosphoribosyltransferase